MNEGGKKTNLPQLEAYLKANSQDEKNLRNFRKKIDLLIGLIEKKQIVFSKEELGWIYAVAGEHKAYSWLDFFYNITFFISGALAITPGFPTILKAAIGALALLGVAGAISLALPVFIPFLFIGVTLAAAIINGIIQYRNVREEKNHYEVKQRLLKIRLALLETDFNSLQQEQRSLPPESSNLYAAPSSPPKTSLKTSETTDLTKFTASFENFFKYLEGLENYNKQANNNSTTDANKVSSYDKFKLFFKRWSEFPHISTHSLIKRIATTKTPIFPLLGIYPDSTQRHAWFSKMLGIIGTSFGFASIAAMFMIIWPPATFIVVGAFIASVCILGLISYQSKIKNRRRLQQEHELKQLVLELNDAYASLSPKAQSEANPLSKHTALEKDSNNTVLENDLNTPKTDINSFFTKNPKLIATKDALIEQFKAIEQDQRKEIYQHLTRINRNKGQLKEFFLNPQAMALFSGISYPMYNKIDFVNNMVVGWIGTLGLTPGFPTIVNAILIAISVALLPTTIVAPLICFGVALALAVGSVFTQYQQVKKDKYEHEAQNKLLLLEVCVLEALNNSEISSENSSEISSKQKEKLPLLSKYVASLDIERFKAALKIPTTLEHRDQSATLSSEVSPTSSNTTALPSKRHKKILSFIKNQYPKILGAIGTASGVASIAFMINPFAGVAFLIVFAIVCVGHMWVSHAANARAKRRDTKENNLVKQINSTQAKIDKIKRPSQLQNASNVAAISSPEITQCQSDTIDDRQRAALPSSSSQPPLSKTVIPASAPEVPSVAGTTTNLSNKKANFSLWKWIKANPKKSAALLSAILIAGLIAVCIFAPHLPLIAFGAKFLSIAINWLIPHIPHAVASVAPALSQAILIVGGFFAGGIIGASVTKFFQQIVACFKPRSTSGSQPQNLSDTIVNTHGIGSSATSSAQMALTNSQSKENGNDPNAASQQLISQVEPAITQPKVVEIDPNTLPTQTSVQPVGKATPISTVNEKPDTSEIGSNAVFQQQENRVVDGSPRTKETPGIEQTIETILNSVSSIENVKPETTVNAASSSPTNLTDNDRNEKVGSAQVSPNPTSDDYRQTISPILAQYRNKITNPDNNATQSAEKQSLRPGSSPALGLAE